MTRPPHGTVTLDARAETMVFTMRGSTNTSACTALVTQKEELLFKRNIMRWHNTGCIYRSSIPGTVTQSLGTHDVSRRP
jgi:hypothetical protein